MLFNRKQNKENKKIGRATHRQNIEQFLSQIHSDKSVFLHKELFSLPHFVRTKTIIIWLHFSVYLGTS